MPSPSENIFSNQAALSAAQVEIRLLAASDVSEAMRLKEQAGWNQTESDWLRLLELEPNGCFAATVGNKPVGTVTTTVYGQKLAWIGMVLVDRDYRRRKIATRLMNAALDYLDNQKVETVKLDATPEGIFVYENLGFEPESTIERWTRAASQTPTTAFSSSENLNLSELLEFDKSCFGADRSKLIEKLAQEKDFPPFFNIAANGRLNGYAFIRRGSAAIYLGPVVAADEKIAEFLLDKALATISGETIYLDANANFKSFEQILTLRGFVRHRELIRMRRGKKTNAAASDKIFAVAGLEVG